MAVICGVCRRDWSACAAIGRCDGHGNQRTVPKPPMPREVAELVEAAKKLAAASPVNRWSKPHIDGTVAAIAAVKSLYGSEP